MDIEKHSEIANLISKLSFVMDTNTDAILDCLEGIELSEKEVSRVKQLLTEGG